MAVLDPQAVKAGQVVPQPGDAVNGYAYVSGDPRVNTSYKPLTGGDYLSSIPKQRADAATSILQANTPLPNGTVLKDPYWKQVYSDVLAAEPDFDATKWKARQNLRASFSAGKDATQIQQLNMGIHHAAGMMNAYDNLDNYDSYPWINSIANTVESGLPTQGGAKIRAGMAAADLNKNALASETAAIFQGGSPHETEIQNYAKDYDPNLGPSASNAALGKAASLFHDRLQTLQSKWKNTMGPTAQDFPIVSPETQAAWNQLNSRYDVVTGEPKPAAKPSAPAKGGIPAGVDPGLWQHMTPQEKSLWLKN